MFKGKTDKETIAKLKDLILRMHDIIMSQSSTIETLNAYINEHINNQGVTR